MKITDVSVDEILDAYDNPNLQQGAVEFVSYLKRFDKTEDDEYIYKMEDIAERIKDRIPYDEVKFNGEWTKEPSFVLMATTMKMISLEFLPSLKDEKEF